MDSKLKLLSFSARKLLHECPRKYQLNRLSAEGTEVDEESFGTFGFGHLVGTGIQTFFTQKLLHGKIDTGVVIFEAFKNWKSDLFFNDEKRRKSFADGVFALRKFAVLLNAGFLKDYELVTFLTASNEYRVACELSFCIHLPSGYKYRGFVDLVLKHKETKEILVVEVKTSSARVIANAFKNSSQAVGYSVVLDTLFGELSSYKVLYLVYKTKEQEYEPIEYKKSSYERALWLNELLLDCENIQRYADQHIFPMYGENCIDKYYKECKYFGICTMRTESLVPVTTAHTEKEENQFDFEIHFEKLIHTQLGIQNDVPNYEGYIATSDDVVL